ncbi:MAG: Nif3-like dinuclear metal center hexameric protein [Synergistaceae bacterium]|jgi:dinuclear metal center YbgI/SA1388 family protein|nr:Nif3-like dinuclear metal center hexameric protein [Synergistaceae bacterium]
MKVIDIIKKIETRIPPEWSEDWDNTGLMLGNPNADVRGIAVSLDATEQSVSDAVNCGCELLITHHPVIFRPISRIISTSAASSAISSALRSGVSVYSAHTNWDSSPEGVNVILSSRLGMSDIAPILPGHDGSWGIGAAGVVKTPLRLCQLAERVKSAWGLGVTLVYGDAESKISSIALCGGAGGDLLQRVIEMGSDVFITADLNYHHLLDAQFSNLSLISVDHGEMERASLSGLCDLIREAVPVEVHLLETHNRTPIVI